MGILTYNPQKEDAERLDSLTCGEDRIAVLDQLRHSLRADVGRAAHQHQLLIGPRGSGKTHLLRVFVVARLARDPKLRGAYLPIVLPEETSLRSPSDLFLRILERLASLAQSGCEGIPREARAAARAACLQATGIAKAMRNPEDRLARACEGLARASDALERTLLPVVENLDSLLYLGGAGKRTAKVGQHWALRRYMQDSSHVLLLASATTSFGAISNPDAPFYDFFRVHELQELSNDEMLGIVRLRLDEELGMPLVDPLRRQRVEALKREFPKRSPDLRGLLSITGGLPRYAHLIYDVLVETDVGRTREVFDEFVNELTPYFQQRLDPRFLPEAELDLLHELASAIGPLTPTELADRLYGARVNEVGQLLDRLQQRGFVKRVGRPGGRAVMWDLTEPMYRVWTRLRAGDTEREQLLLLAEFVAVLFTERDVENERDGLLQERRFLAALHPDEVAVQWAFSATLFNTIHHAKAEGDLARRDALLDELREVAHRKPSAGPPLIVLADALEQNPERAQEGEALSALEEGEALLREDSTDDRWWRAQAALTRARLASATGQAESALDQLGRALEIWSALADAQRVELGLGEITEVLQRCDWDSAMAEGAVALVGTVFRLLPEQSRQALLNIGVGLLRHRGPEALSAVLPRMEALLEDDSTGFLRPLRLGMEVLQHGEEKALAREPEEMRRAVRLLLGKIKEDEPGSEAASSRE